MSKTTPKNFKKIEDKLLKQQKEVDEELKELEKDDPVKAEGLPESLESGTESWMADVHGRAVALTDSLKTLSVRIKKSLALIKSGKYGKCDNCGKQIEFPRLLAMPTATLCVACSKLPNKKS